MELTDKEYVERCRDGHPDDFRSLVDRYQGPLFSFLAGRLKDHGQAEEAAQESFVRAFQALRKLRKPESFYSWLLGIAGRVAKEQFRALTRRQQDCEVAEFIMPGQSTVLYIKPGNVANKLSQPTPGGSFDTTWLDRIANLSTTIENELKNAAAKGWKLGLREERGADGRTKSVVTVEAKSGLPEGDYIKNKFFDNADTRRVYRFDAQSELLESVQVYLAKDSGEVLIFELTQIYYSEPFAAGVFQLDLPANVNWVKELEVLPDNAKYAAMTAEQAARAFFEACANKDWDEAQKFEVTPITDRMKQYLGGLEIVSLGTAFTSKGYDPNGRFVPYEIKFRPQTLFLKLSNANSAKRFVITGACDEHMKPAQEMHWTNSPAILPDNDTYAKLTALEAAKAYFNAVAKQDWAEMKKFAPDYDVNHDQRRAAEAKKAGMDPRNFIPATEVLEEIWSAEQSAWLVKCRMAAVRKWNLALKKDAKTGRWHVDGGL